MCWHEVLFTCRRVVKCPKSTHFWQFMKVRMLPMWALDSKVLNTLYWFRHFSNFWVLISLQLYKTFWETGVGHRLQFYACHDSTSWSYKKPFLTVMCIMSWCEDADAHSKWNANLSCVKTCVKCFKKNMRNMSFSILFFLLLLNLN